MLQELEIMTDIKHEEIVSVVEKLRNISEYLVYSEKYGQNYFE
jgi:hypothetical protein